MEILSTVDIALLKVINAPAGKVLMLDSAVNALRDVALVKSGYFMVLWWWLWRRYTSDSVARQRLLAVLLVSIPAIAIGRLLALALPFRLRPLHETGLEVALPTDMSMQYLSGWSSLPSDHAVMFFSIAAGLFLVDRVFGILAAVFALIFVCLPRVYSGLHYPSDILLGALIGVVVAIVFMPLLVRFITKLWLIYSPANMTSIWLIAVFLSIQIVTMYELPRHMLAQLGLHMG